MLEIDKYLEWKGSYAPIAQAVYGKQLERFDGFVKKDFDDIKIGDISKYTNFLRKKYSGKTIEFNLIIIKNFFNFYAKQGRVVISPDLIKSPRTHANSHQPITEREYLLMLAYLPNNDFISLRDKLVIGLLWDTGIRVSELCDLNLSDIDIQNNCATIKTKKNETSRRIFWSSEVAFVMKRYVGIRISMNASQPLLVGMYSGRVPSMRMTTRTAQRIVKTLALQAGITKKISPHSFRHGWACHRRDKGAPLSFIQKGLGHQNPVSTFVYEQYADPEFEKHARGYL